MADGCLWAAAQLWGNDHTSSGGRATSETPASGTRPHSPRLGRGAGTTAAHTRHARLLLCRPLSLLLVSA